MSVEMQLPNFVIKMLTLVLANMFLFGRTDAVNDSPTARLNPITKNVTVIAGDTAVLPCSVNNLGEFVIVWQNSAKKILTARDRRIYDDDRMSLERPYKYEWNLHIRQVRREDTGLYQCQINTSPVQIQAVQLIVQEPSKIIEHLSTDDVLEVTEGDTVELVCNVTGFPTPTVTWYRVPTGLMQDADTEKKQIGMEGEVLVIHNVSRYCDDEYECVAFNGVADADSRTIRVNVQFPPEVRLPTRKIGQYLGLNTILECQVTAFPNRYSVWKYRGKPVIKSTGKYVTEIYNEGPNKITLSLKIQHFTKDDYGDYECYAQNHLGRDSAFMKVYEYRRKITTTTTRTTTRRRKYYATTRPYSRKGSNLNPDWGRDGGNPYPSKVVSGEDDRDDTMNNGYKNDRVDLGPHAGQSRSGNRGGTGTASALRQDHTTRLSVVYLSLLLLYIISNAIR